jgi:transcriptional regulator with XRE-family HTH domain
MRNISSNHPKARNRMRICRMTEGLSQKDLAFLLDIPVTSISRWENCSRAPGVYYAIGISVATHRLVDEIFSDYRHEWKDKIQQKRELLEESQKQDSKESNFIRSKKFNDNDNVKRYGKNKR